MNIDELKVKELPKTCNECGRKCGAREMPTAWAVYWDDYSYWACDNCYARMFSDVDNEFVNAAKKNRIKWL